MSQPAAFTPQEQKMISLVQTLLDIFAGKQPLEDIEAVMDEHVIHHNFLITRDEQKHFEQNQGIQEWKTWAIILRKAVKNLSVEVKEYFVRGDRVYVVFRWMADEWHPSIKGNPKHSNYVFAEYTVDNDKITATFTCRQNYLFIFGTDFNSAHLRQTYQDILGFGTSKTCQDLEQPLANKSVKKSVKKTDQKIDQNAVAIIGMSGVMPGADTPDAFWDRLVDQDNLFTKINADQGSVNRSNLCDQLPVAYAALLENVDKFDPLFFNISPKEARWMDPQQRLILQTAWQAIENSGCPISDFANDRSAIFIGSSNQDYKQLFQAGAQEVEALSYTGMESSMLATRVAINFFSAAFWAIRR